MIAVSLPKPEDSHGFDEPFRPLRPASGPKLIAAFVLGPFLWVAALLLASWLLDRTYAIQLGLLITAASLVVSAVVLTLLRVGRRREERRYADRA
jgi:membrane protein DedA with SNARE-associated domain